ncbi:hypothetical protein [Hymenobacter sp. CRA2]|uniref:hypothetical protein n=1 Tax=Hymenobacter sp. CRA2 TaxID=1955620 RepID=UPI0011160BB7|nr:hypothetical protein [Hymenobacter sp. CRA2]
MSTPTALLLTASLGAEPAPAAYAAETVANASANDEALAAAAQLQIGDFVLGDLDCPSLTGHPDIRY